ncbi:5-formyltetrahydrofolate cyclo-ligase, partial [Clostridium perfringens]|uniref:5-formyltetrahydrofolate cyclo-ligase n=1 Tax=Clostridium perfringens TaxID=1502 RepID=UPI002AC5D9D7
YYDRYLEDIKYKNNKVALAYDIQIVESIDAETHDVKIDYIVTNSKIIDKF